MTLDGLIATARSYVGTPFRHQGRLPGIALDCAGVAVCAARAEGWPAIDMPGYSRTPTKGMLRQHLMAQPALRLVNRSPRFGDLLLMAFGREDQHVALCAGDTIIHAYEAVGKVCEHGFTDEWQKRVVAVFEFVEAAE